MKSPFRLFFALFLGMILGSIAHQFQELSIIQGLITYAFQPMGQIFLRILFMIVVPMIFSGLALGVYELAKNQGVGKVARQTLFYTIIASTCSVLIGVFLVNVIRPGEGLNFDTNSLNYEKQSEQINKISEQSSNAKPIMQSLVEIIPKNPLDAAVKALDGEMLALMFCALLFGIAFYLFEKSEVNRKQLHIIGLFEEIFGGCMKIVHFAMSLAPYAVFALTFQTATKFGLEIFQNLFMYVAVVVIGLLLQQFIVYAPLLKFAAKRSPWKFFSICRDVYLYAFSTSSSNATLPKSIEVAETELKLNPAISKFVLTVGATANQNGTALFEGVTVLFLAQVFGVDLSLTQQFHVVLMCIVAGIGTAGVPGGSLPLVMIIMNSVGVPAEGMALILGVDRFLDMCRTTLNVSGDLVIAALVDEKK
jgi:DAACS family dicarboxylate/amino acid:cation (Na+ or H+) symporter